MSRFAMTESSITTTAAITMLTERNGPNRTTIQWSIRSSGWLFCAASEN